MSILCYQIKKIPDLTLNKYQTLSDTGVKGVLKRHSNFLRQWHGICLESDASLHLLYILDSKEIKGNRLKLYLMIQSNPSNHELLNSLLKYSPLNDFYEFTECSIPNYEYTSSATFLKSERIAELYNPLSENSRIYHYVPKWEINEDARLYDLFKVMEALIENENTENCAYRIDLYPANMIQSTRRNFTPIVKMLQGDSNIQIVRNTMKQQHDDYSKEILKEYENWLKMIETNPHFNINIYSFSKNNFQTKMILNAVGAEAIVEGNFSIVNLKKINNQNFNVLYRINEYVNEYCIYPDYSRLKSWATTYTLNEAEPFFRLPVLFDGEVIELPKETAPKVNEERDGIYIGNDINSFPIYFPIKDLSRHAFFSGMPGSGKTNTMLHIVTELKKRKIPLLVLEPAKKEYRELLLYEDMRDIFLFSPHLQSRFPLQVNPFAFPLGVRLSEHINSLMEVFEGSFYLEGPTYKFLSDAIQKSYEQLGWDIEEINIENKQLCYPTLQNVYQNLEKEIERSSYDVEIKGNVRAFLQVRLGSLMERDAGEIFNTTFSTIEPHDWINISAIVELEVLTNQTKNFFVLLVLHYILETLRINPNNHMNTLRHAIFIEEAHNIISSSSEQSNFQAVDPKISATAYIVKMLAEVRALNEAIIIADQLPTALASEVTKNTGLKLVHRLTSKDDREQIGTSISASPLQLEQMATFSKGKAFIYHEKVQKAFQVQVAEWIKPIACFNFSDDNQLYIQLSRQENMFKSISVAIDNWHEKYINPIYEEIILFEKELLTLTSDDYVNKTIYIAKKELLINSCENIRRKYTRFKKLWIDDFECYHKETLKQMFDDTLEKLLMLEDELKKIVLEKG